MVSKTACYGNSNVNSPDVGRWTTASSPNPSLEWDFCRQNLVEWLGLMHKKVLPLLPCLSQAEVTNLMFNFNVRDKKGCIKGAHINQYEFECLDAS